MAIAFVTQGTTPTGIATGTGTTAVTPALPSGLVNGNIVVIYVFTKPDTAPPITPVEWTYAGAVAGGGGTTGLDAGPMRVTAFYRIKRSNWSAMPAITVTSGSCATAQAFQYSNATGYWAVDWAGGADTTSATTWSVTGDRNPGLTAGDMLLVGTATHTDTITWSAQATTATGISAWGTQAERSEPITTNGNDLGGCVSQHPVTTGTASAAPVFTATASAAATGVSLFVRLREIAEPDIIGSTYDFASGGVFNQMNWGDFGTIQAGDLALCFWSHSTTSVETTLPSAHGFTRYGDITDETVVHGLWTKTCTGTESGTIGYGLEAASRTSTLIILIRGWVIDTLTSLGDTGSDASHTPASVTPTASNAAIIISSGERSTSGTTYMTPPTGYSLAQQSAAFGSAGSYTGVAYEGTDGFLTAGHASGVAVNPGPMVHNFAAAPVGMWTIALKPPGAAPVIEATVALTATSTLTATATQTTPTPGPSVTTIPKDFTDPIWTLDTQDVRVSSTRIELDATNWYSIVYTSTYYNLVGARLFAKVAQLPTAEATTYTEVIFRPQFYTPLHVKMKVENGVITCYSKTVPSQSGDGPLIATTAWDPAKPYLGFRESSGTLYFERSATGVDGTWEVIGSTTQFPIVSANYLLFAASSTAVSPATRGTAYYESLNTAETGGPVTATVALTATSTLTAAGFEERIATVALAATSTLTATGTAGGADLIAAMTFPVYIAHRGGSLEGPENTMTAYARAAAIHPSVVLECDCQRNGSGTLVLMHDTTVDRTAGNGETGNVSSYTDAMWNTLTVDDPVSTTDAPAAYWSQLRDGYTTRVLFPEASASGVGTDFVNAYTPALAKRIVVQAFNRTTCTNLANAGYYVVQLYSGGALDLADDAARGIWGIAYPAGHAEQGTSMTNTAHGLGLKVLVYTPNSTGSRDTHLGFGVDGIFTDAPTTLGIYTGTQPASVSLNAASTLTVIGYYTRPVTVALTATSTLTATAVRMPQASVSLTATSTLTASAVVTELATVTLAAASTLTASATITPAVFGSVALVASATLTATAVRQPQATVSLVAASTLTVAATTTPAVFASVALSASSTLTATAVREPQAAVSLIAASTLTATSVRVVVPTVALSGTSTLSATGTTVGQVPATVALVAASTLTAGALVTEFGAVALTAASTLTASATTTPAVFGSVALSATSTLTATAVRGPQASVSLVAASTLTATATRFGVPLAVVPLTASSTLVATGLRTVFPTTALVGTSTLTTTAATLGQVSASVSLVTTGTLTTAGIRVQAASAALVAASTLTTGAVVQEFAVVSLTAVSSLTATAVRIPQASVSLVAGSTLTATGLRTVLPTVALSASSTLTPSAVSLGQVSATVTLSATAVLVVSGVRVRMVAVALSASSSLTATGVRQRPATVTMTATATLTAQMTRTFKSAVGMTATSILTVTATARAPAIGIENASQTGVLYGMDAGVWNVIAAAG